MLGRSGRIESFFVFAIIVISFLESQLANSLPTLADHSPHELSSTVQHFLTRVLDRLTDVGRMQDRRPRISRRVNAVTCSSRFRTESRRRHLGDVTSPHIERSRKDSLRRDVTHFAIGRIEVGQQLIRDPHFDSSSAGNSAEGRSGNVFVYQRCQVFIVRAAPSGRCIPVRVRQLFRTFSNRTAVFFSVYAVPHQSREQRKAIGSFPSAIDTVAVVSRPLLRSPKDRRDVQNLRTR